MSINIIWFKRDLRIHDHQALQQATQQELPILLLFVFEQELFQQDDFSYRHYKFLKESVIDLQKNIANINAKLITKNGEIINILNQLHKKYNINQIFSHQETGNYWTYQRDINVKKFCIKNSIKWQEYVQNGVIRNLKNRDGWALSWHKTMSKNIIAPPNYINFINEDCDPIFSAQKFNISYDQILSPQIGGRDNGLKIFDDFLQFRGQNYSKEMSSPVSAFTSCSRISTYLTFGSISIKEIYQAALARSLKVKSLNKEQKGQWPQTMRSFLSRLRWHCHFIQKLEDEPEIEYRNLHPSYDLIRNEFNEEFYEAWKNSKTGFPMIDASMQALKETGWINFRMRAMLVSFAANHLWLDWRKFSHHLARLFTDYEPGIHYSQIQMQSGTTGINAIRIYSPTKQLTDHDPEGIFIKKYLPILKDVSKKTLIMPSQEGLFAPNYPEPIINEKEARKNAITQLYNIKNNPSHKIEAKNIVKKHASRK